MVIEKIYFGDTTITCNVLFYQFILSTLHMKLKGNVSAVDPCN